MSRPRLTGSAAWGLSALSLGTGLAPAAPRAAPSPARPRPAASAPAIGCRARGSGYRRSGSPQRRRVALTFDDGPGVTTPRILNILRNEHAVATFFVVGKEVPGHAGLVRRELTEGHAVGNHTFTHANVAGGGLGQLARTQTVARRFAHYTPCLFRPPYNAVSATIIGQARRMGMATIGWNVDPRDWARPGSAAIAARVAGAVRPGSIVILHDGGGSRGQTAAALPAIIHTLRRRGYRLVTVPQLLGFAARRAAPRPPPGGHSPPVGEPPTPPESAPETTGAAAGARALPTTGDG